MSTFPIPVAWKGRHKQVKMVKGELGRGVEMTAIGPFGLRLSQFCRPIQANGSYLMYIKGSRLLTINMRESSQKSVNLLIILDTGGLESYGLGAKGERG